MSDTNEIIERAWGIIANAHGGNWSEASNDWREAAERWRDEMWFPWLEGRKVEVTDE